MSTTTIARPVDAPKKRTEGLVIATRAIINARTPISAGCFYGALIALIVGALYPSLSSLNLQGYVTSPAISSMIGGHAKSFSSFTSFVAIELFSALYGLLFGGIMAYAAGAALPINIENGTLDLALARPVSRTRFYLETVFGILTGGILMGLFILLCVRLSELLVKNPDLDWQWVWITQLVQYAFFVFAIGIGFLFGSFMNASRAAGGVAVGIIALGYLINLFGALSDKYAWLLKIGPFYYAPATDLLISHQLMWWYPLVLVAAGLICGIVGLIIFNRRDLPVS